MPWLRKRNDVQEMLAPIHLFATEPKTEGGDKFPRKLDEYFIFKAYNVINHYGSCDMNFQNANIKNTQHRSSLKLRILIFITFVLPTSGFQVFADNIDALFIDKEGNVGIGQKQPAAKLDVKGVIKGIGMVPPGGIVMFSGAIDGNFDKNGRGFKGTSYEGWHLCNGQTSGVPDLRGKFIAAASYGKEIEVPDHENEIYEVGHERGTNGVKLTREEIPVHDHGGKTGDATTTKYKSTKTAKISGFVTAGHDVSGTSQELPTHQHTIPSIGGGQAHENRPEFYVLAFIMRIQ